MAAVVSQRPRRGVFPGSFNPLTVAHVEIARLAHDRYELDTVVLVVSRVALDKPAPPGPGFEERLALLRADAAAHSWLAVEHTDKQLIAEIAQGFDVVIMGADKWIQVNDPAYYVDNAARDAALATLPTVVVAERAGVADPGDEVTLLKTPADLHDVSSSAARAGNRDLMAPEARKHWKQRPPTPPH